MKPILVFVMLLLSIAPAAAQYVCLTDHELSCRQRYVGKKLWVAIPADNPNVIEVTFTRGDWTESRTLKLKNGTSFLVTGVVADKTYGFDYVVRLDDGRVGWTSANGLFLIDYDPVARARAAEKECERRGQPKIGMSRGELIETCWRKPARVVKKTTAAGVEENYIYGRGHVIKLNEGKVTEIIEAR